MDTALDQLQRESINYPSGKQRGIEIVLLGSKHGRDTRERHHGGRQNHPLNKQKNVWSLNLAIKKPEVCCVEKQDKQIPVFAIF